jgi:hypothetical protein
LGGTRVLQPQLDLDQKFKIADQVNMSRSKRGNQGCGKWFPMA